MAILFIYRGRNQPSPVESITKSEPLEKTWTCEIGIQVHHYKILYHNGCRHHSRCTKMFVPKWLSNHGCITLVVAVGTTGAVYPRGCTYHLCQRHFKVKYLYQSCSWLRHTGCTTVSHNVRPVQYNFRLERYKEAGRFVILCHSY